MPEHNHTEPDEQDHDCLRFPFQLGSEYVCELCGRPLSQITGRPLAAAPAS